VVKKGTKNPDQKLQKKDHKSSQTRLDVYVAPKVKKSTKKWSKKGLKIRTKKGLKIPAKNSKKKDHKSSQTRLDVYVAPKAKKIDQKVVKKARKK
jgi:hypothetical protein